MVVGGRRAWMNALVAYALIGAIVAVSFYSRRIGSVLDDGFLFLAWGLLAIGSLISLYRAWRNVARGEPIQLTQQIELLPRRLRRWVVGGTGEDR